MEKLNLTRENCIYTHCYWWVIGNIRITIYLLVIKLNVKYPFSFFSEENVWKLCEHLKEKVDVNQFYVVFISNANKQVYIKQTFSLT